MINWKPIEDIPEVTDDTRYLLFRKGWAENKCVGWYSRLDECWIPVNGSVFPGVTHYAEIENDPE